VHYAVVVARNSRRPGVEIKIRIVIEIAGSLLAHFIDEIAVPQGHVTTTDTVRRFDYRNVIAGALQFISDRKSGYSSAKDGNLLPASGDIFQVEPGYRARVFHQPKRSACLVYGGRAASGADKIKKMPSRQWFFHASGLSFWVVTEFVPARRRKFPTIFKVF
jgi:hypothetical protein